MNKLSLAVVGASALALSTAGIAGGIEQAPQVAPNATTGFYVTAGVGYGKSNITGKGVKNKNVLFNAALGYRFNPYLAVEGGYMYLPSVKGPVTVNGKTTSVRVHLNAIYAALKGIYPISNNFDVFAEGGAAVTFTSASLPGANISSKKHQIVPVVGVGADYAINQNLAVTLKGIATLRVNNRFPATYGGTIGLTYFFG